jgi:hypothetical protein
MELKNKSRVTEGTLFQFIQHLEHNFEQNLESC